MIELEAGNNWDANRKQAKEHAKEHAKEQAKEHAKDGKE